jgi:hypothetical protein
MPQRDKDVARNSARTNMPLQDDGGEMADTV